MYDEERWIMRKLSFLVAFGLLAIHQVSFTYDQHMPKTLFIQVELNDQVRYQDQFIGQRSIKNRLKTSTNNHRWIAIENKSFKHAGQFVVLTKIEKADSKAVTMRFLVLNTEMKPRLISAPKITMMYGKEERVMINEKNRRILLAVTTTANAPAFPVNRLLSGNI